MKSNSFTKLNIRQEILTAIESLDYKQMTEIQEKSLPYILDKKDITAKAKTGSGKTAAFGIGVLNNIDITHKYIQSLILCPTRELAEQVSEEIRKLARFISNLRVLTICGGRSFKSQSDSLSNNSHIVVATPGRLLDHINKNTIDLKKINTLVLDESDRMLDMGFENDINIILSKTNNKKQVLLFSATTSNNVKTISKKIQKNPINISVNSSHSKKTIKQLFFEIKKHERNNTVIKILQCYKPESCIIFCNTKVQCKELSEKLKELNFDCLYINSNLEQKDRNQILIKFANKSSSILVATDVAARGLDIENVDLVINYDLARDSATHMHRIGRTGRADKTGKAFSLYLASEEFKLKKIEDLQKQPAICDVPESLDYDPEYKIKSKMKTVMISAGKKQKLRKSDILGALTGEIGLSFDKIGLINIADYYSYVAIDIKSIKSVYKQLQTGKIKGKNFKISII